MLADYANAIEPLVAAAQERRRASVDAGGGYDRSSCSRVRRGERGEVEAAIVLPGSARA